MHKKRQKESGFSIFELVIVVAIVAILSTIAALSFYTEKIYKADTQALNIIDVLQEARQRALSQRTTMRVEVNRTEQLIQLINENSPTTSSDDEEVRTVSYTNQGVFVGTQPSNYTAGNPVELSPTPRLAFRTSNHPLSVGDRVGTIRFLRNGTVSDAGTDDIGTGARIRGATILVWSKYADDTSTNPNTVQIMRAVTVQRTSGLTRLWKCPLENGTCATWIK